MWEMIKSILVPFSWKPKSTKANMIISKFDYAKGISFIWNNYAIQGTLLGLQEIQRDE